MKKDQQFFFAENIEINRANRAAWVEDNFSVANQPSESQVPGFMSLSLSEKKLTWLFLLLAGGLGLLLFKAFYLQIIRGDYYFSLAENNRLRIEYTKAPRGIIYDRNGQQLVQNVFGFSLLVIPAQLPADETEKNQILTAVSRLAGVDLEEIKTRIAGAHEFYYQPILIKTGIGYEQAMALYIAAADLPGLTLDADFWRKYPYPESLSHLLGYVGKIDAAEYAANQDTYLFNDNIGKAGLEETYESYLNGRHGQKKIEIDALGREKKIVSQTQFIAGDGLLLALDVGLQEKIFNILKAKAPNGRAAVVVSNPQNGEILALVDYPSYDNNLFSPSISVEEYEKLLADSNQPLFSRSIFGEYPSGSTIKPVLAAAALQEEIIDSKTIINSVGGINVGQWFFPDWQAGGHGATNVIKALAWSVNTFFYYIGGGFGDFKGLGIERIIKYFKLFGLGQPTGIDLPGERSGFVPSPEWKESVRNEVWYIGDTYHLSIGQGDLLVTPLQINNYTSAIANGGKLLVPQLATGIIRADGSREIFSVKIIRENFISAANLAIVREGMRATVLSGSARSLSALPVAVAGKTGTAQWSSTKPNHAWFTGFAPYDSPNFCLTVLVEEGGEGSAIAVPIAKEIMNYWFSQPR